MDLDKMTDLELVEAVKGGNKNAFATLVKRYQNKVYSTVLRMCRSREDAEDISQEIFLKVYSGLSRFRAESSFSTYLYKICTNTTIDHIRKQNSTVDTTSLYKESDDGLYLVEPEDSAPSPMASLEQKEKIALLRQAIEALPENHREIIILREINELSYDEIGEILDLEEGTVKSRINRARAKLKKELEKSGNIFGYNQSKEKEETNLAKEGGE